MVLGDPYKFAVLLHVIPEWNEDETWRNGLLMLFVDGWLFPPAGAENATLSYEILRLKNLLHIEADAPLFEMDRDEAFRTIYRLRFPDAEDENAEEDLRFDLTPDALGDRNCFVFGVRKGEQVRVLAAGPLPYDKKESRHSLQSIFVRETVISSSELSAICRGLEEWDRCGT